VRQVLAIGWAGRLKESKRGTGATERRCLLTEAIKRAALALESIDNIHGDDGLAACVLSVRDRVANDRLKENLQNIAGLVVDEAGDTFHAATACQTANRGLGDALDVIPQDLSMALSAALAETLATLAASRHVGS
jgi:hypothetical protein